MICNNASFAEQIKVFISHWQVMNHWFNILSSLFTRFRMPERGKQCCNLFTRCTWAETCNILVRESAFGLRPGFFLHNHFLSDKELVYLNNISDYDGRCFTVRSNSCSEPGRDRRFWMKSHIWFYLEYSLSWNSRSRGPDSCLCWPCTW